MKWFRVIFWLLAVSWKAPFLELRFVVAGLLLAALADIWAQVDFRKLLRRAVKVRKLVGETLGLSTLQLNLKNGLKFKGTIKV